MLKSKSTNQQKSQEIPRGAPVSSDRKKPLSDNKIKTVCLVVFILVAAGGIYINLGKVPGGTGFSLPFFNGGGQSKTAQRKAIMNSDMSDAAKAAKLQRLSQQE
jgi:hypothetical protein